MPRTVASVRWTLAASTVGLLLLAGCASHPGPAATEPTGTTIAGNAQQDASGPQDRVGAESKCTASNGASAALLSAGYTSSCRLTTASAKVTVLKLAADTDCAILWDHPNGTPKGDTGSVALNQTYEEGTNFRLGCKATDASGTGRIRLLD